MHNNIKFDEEINVQTQTAVRPILKWGMDMLHTWKNADLDELLEDLEEAYLLSPISNEPEDRDKFLVFRDYLKELDKILDGTTEDEVKYTCEFILTLCKPHHG